MKENKILITTDLTSSVSKDSFSNMSKLPNVQQVDENIGAVNNVIESKPQERNKRKRETNKGTILQAVMIEKDLLKLVKHSAFYNEKSISEVINQALRLFFN